MEVESLQAPADAPPNSAAPAPPPPNQATALRVSESDLAAFASNNKNKRVMLGVMIALVGAVALALIMALVSQHM
jgi:hypothetical protein